MIKFKSKTFKGVNADIKLETFINDHVHTYMIGNYEGKCNTPDRMIQILYIPKSIEHLTN